MARPATEHDSTPAAGASRSRADSETGSDFNVVRGPEVELSSIPAGFPEDPGEGCVRLDAAVVLRATPRSFALRVKGQSMVGADIYDGDIVIGEFTPNARPGHVVVALIDGEVTLKRLIVRGGKPQLISENPMHPNLVPISELVVQGVVHTVVHRLA